MASGLSNATNPERGLPDWSNDPAALTAHVRAYFTNMGVADCQIQSAQVLGGSDGRTISLSRAVDSIPIVESNAYAHFNVNDRSTSEELFWPTISADVVAGARALRDKLADPAALEAYRAKLPASDRGAGHVAIHHSSFDTSKHFQAVAAWDTISGNSPLSFDENGTQLSPF